MHSRVLLAITLLGHVLFWTITSANAAVTQCKKEPDYNEGSAVHRASTGVDVVTYWSLQFSPDGRSIALASSKGVSLFDSHNLQALWQFDAPGDRAIRALVFSPDSSVIAGTSVDGLLRIWDARAGVLLREVTMQEIWMTSLIHSVAFSTDGSLVATSTDLNRVVHLWRSADLTLQKTFLSANNTGMMNITFSPDDTSLTAVAQGEVTPRRIRSVSVVSWDVATGNVTRFIDGPQPTISTSVSADSMSLLTVTWEDDIALWRITADMMEQVSRFGRFPRSRLGDNYVAHATDGGRALIATTADMRLRVIDANNGCILREEASGASGFAQAGISKDGTNIAYVTRDGILWVVRY